MRIALGIEYDGSSFHGWQKQPGGNTVQDALEGALGQIAGQPIDVVCAGRTDAGVHATAQVVHFDTDVKRAETAWVRGGNSFLPATVSIRWARPVSDDFHARFSAHGRCYRYLLINRPQRPGLCHDRAGWCHRPLDIDRMQESARLLLGEHDFSAFRAAGCQARSPVKTMRTARVHQRGEMFVFEFEAGSFLHHMVRNLVGSLVYIGQGRQPPAWMGYLLQQRNRSLAAPTFGAAGLYLVGVRYEARWNLPEPGDDCLPFLPGYDHAP